MTLRIYNTLSRKKETFSTLEKEKVKMYVCGPTVYDVPHIGHARSAYVFDFMRHYLEFLGYSVTFVRNVTDIDDKIINRARGNIEKKGLGCDPEILKDETRAVSEKYLDLYLKQMDDLGIQEPTHQPTATENISRMISAVEKLIEKGDAYLSGGDVYFNVESFETYGQLSGREKSELLSGVRKKTAETKKGRLDFALWKKAKPGEPSWPSPWGEGRPGWHIECSVMSTSILGACFDIHGGGLDLLFPHHENELAQARALTGGTFAKWWVHNGLLTVNGEKMSKSLGNYITISDFLDQYKDSDILKITFLSTHYRKAIDCTPERFHEAGQIKERVTIYMEKVRRSYGDRDLPEDHDLTGALEKEIEKAMDDDFNTPVVIKTLLEAVKLGNEVIEDDDLLEKEKIYRSGVYASFIMKWGGLFSLSFSGGELPEEKKRIVERLIEEREQARRDKDYPKSDRIREELAKKGVTVEDTPEGTVWRKA